MSIDNFSAVMLISYLLFLDRRWLDRLLHTRSAPPATMPLRARNVITVAAVLPALLLVVWWNASTIRIHGHDLMPQPAGVARSSVQLLGIWQGWNLFSPRPSTDDGWLTAVGRFEDGRKIDLLTGKPESARMRRFFIGPDMRWKKYESNLVDGPTAHFLQAALGQSLCVGPAEQLDKLGHRLYTVRLRWWSRSTPGWREAGGPYTPELIWLQLCYCDPLSHPPPSRKQPLPL